ncbi:MAG: hypothetical protein KA191_09690 [Verrucomicrobia bacterium]|jgi:hypothetical protein|nr:hypothetical protein [Verrucomicrobiota bacterium]OQC63700.1 MAG: hypothetical protein BWX48_03103 [Verrucomicrobia bacterium ADurb.Bin006]MDI9379931.1 hypothetical protein [Verrucomicrobiota bacterium]NMD22493.1 hypothetical protein [Verrucomicrobiota bacterium]HNU98457.1 hypothetical protein [Verrucomicrobiota bacterium]
MNPQDSIGGTSTKAMTTAQTHLRSHQCAFTARDLAEIVGAPLGVLLLLAALFHFAAAADWLPAPRPTLDMDRTLLIHQADSSRSAQDATVILIGDSSCLMDVSASDLTRHLGQPTLNLGLLSYLDLPSFGILVRNYAHANPERLETVVLLLHPESLRLQAPSAYHRAQLEDYLAGRDAHTAGGIGGRLQTALGAILVRGRLEARVIPAPLSGVYGRFYGFTRDFSRWLGAHRGSAIDPQRFDRTRAQGNAEYRLAPRLESESRLLRQCVPSGVRLVVGLTPAPRSFVRPDHEATCARILEQLAKWLKADAVLAGLPASMPDELFASVTHLTGEGQTLFTQRLAAEMQTAAIVRTPRPDWIPRAEHLMQE